MKHYICMSLFVIVMLIPICGCGNKKEKFMEDTYNEGTDYQYMFVDPDFNFSFQQKGKKGYYIINNGYRIYYDPETDTATPLCNRVDCLHDKETNEFLQKKCYARFDWFENGIESQIQYYDGNLYMLTPLDTETDSVTLMKYPEDGSEGSAVRVFKHANIRYWIIHRGYMYFCAESYSIEGEENGDVDAQKGVFRCSVLDDNAKAECIYTPPKDINSQQLATIQAYGNHIYFYEMGFTESVQGKDYKEYLAWKVYHYDIRTKKLSEIMVDEYKDNKYATTQNGAGCFAFVDGKLLFSAIDVREGQDHEKDGYGIGTQWYLADLDGSNQKKVLESKNQYDHVFCDGRYVYVDNQFKVEYVAGNYDEEEKQIEQKFQVYDKNMNFVDELTLPFDHAVGTTIGDEQYQFMLLGDDNNGITAYWKKDDIGHQKGKFPKIKEVYKILCPEEE